MGERRQRRYWGSLPISVVVGICLLAGCRSGATGDPHAHFVSVVEQVCTRAVARHDGHPFPVAGFDPERPDPRQLPRVGKYFARYGGLPQTTRALHTLSPPQADAASWSVLLAIADQITHNAQHQIAAARSRDVTSFVRTTKIANRLTARINDAGSRFGFTSGSSCGQVYG
jgi:hypothetical protein